MIAKKCIKQLIILSIYMFMFYTITFGDGIADEVHSPVPITTQDIIAGDVFFEVIEPQEIEYTFRLRPAKDFGPVFSKRMENIALVPTNPPEACGKITNARDLRGNVAFMVRGECSFISKTLNAERQGAVAAIITEFNNESREYDFYIEMISDNTEREPKIPAGFLLGKNGIVIRNTLRRLKRTHAIINIPVNLTFVPPAKINHPPWLNW